MNKNELPEPKDGVDFYIDAWYSYTISIDVGYTELQGDKSDSAICSEAIRQFIEGSLDGDATIVHRAKIKDVELDYNTGALFNRQAWEISKCAELGFNRDGTPLRPWQKSQPKSQMKIVPFL